AVLVAATVAAHLVWVGRMLRDRRRQRLDWPLRFVLTGTSALALTTAFGLGLAFDAAAGPRAALAYGVLALGGWATFTIAGMMLKIGPVLVWSSVYAPRVGLAPVPSVAALSWPAAERLAWALLAVGVAGLTLAVAAGDGVWIHRATLVTAAGALTFAAAVGHSLWPVLIRLNPPLYRWPARGDEPAQPALREDELRFSRRRPRPRRVPHRLGLVRGRLGAEIADHRARPPAPGRLHGDARDGRCHLDVPASGRRRRALSPWCRRGRLLARDRVDREPGARRDSHCARCARGPAGHRRQRVGADRRCGP